MIVSIDLERFQYKILLIKCNGKRTGQACVRKSINIKIVLFWHSVVIGIQDILVVNVLVLLAVHKLLVAPDNSTFYYDNENLKKFKHFYPGQIRKVV